MAHSIEKEEIKKQIDEIIILMEEQIEVARLKQTVIDNLITTTEKASEEISKMKEVSQSTSMKKHLPIALVSSAGILIVGGALLYLIVR
ncbi:hypothetical protein NEOKW01_2022 [Nematocida sp. AWRm80]|nr:hypothetical protein NEOKW01_2022 [Nematocida sp. AWRm80]